jgi:cation-transporting P-type ATPase D
METSVLKSIILMLIVAAFLYFKRKKTPAPSNAKYRIIKNLEQLEKVTKHILAKQIPFLGIDTEYHKGKKYQGKLSIIQLSLKVKQNIHVYIIDLLCFDVETIHKHLSPILTNQKIEKIIHSCSNDIEWIYDQYGIRTDNIFDTQDFAQFASQKRNAIGLDELLNTHFNLNMDKKVKKAFQKSDWSLRPLSHEQLEYAASDAYYLIDLREKLLGKASFGKLEDYKKRFNERVARIYSITKSERKANSLTNYLYTNLVSIEGIVLENLTKLYIEMYEVVDTFAKEKDVNKDFILSRKLLYKLLIKSPTSIPEAITIIKADQHNEFVENNPEYMDLLEKQLCLIKKFYSEFNINLSEHKEKPNKRFHKGGQKIRSAKVSTLETCKKPIYENCKMLAPDNQVLCLCDSKKMNWYLQKDIAELISEEPPTFRLKFEPNRRGAKNTNGTNSEFYLTVRKNCCVVCGAENDYMRFHVIPVLYRQYLPNSLKSHRSHDVVLLCLRCHVTASRLYDLEKKNISEKYNIPMNQLSDSQKDMKDFKKHTNYVKSLYTNYDEMPEPKKQEIKEILFAYLDENMDNQLVMPYVEEVFVKNNIQVPLDPKEINKDMLFHMKSYKAKVYVTGDKKNICGKLVINQIDDHLEFIKGWRKFFVEALKPGFLPNEWDVEHEIERDFGEFSKFNH